MYAPENCYAVKEEGSIFVLVNGNYIVLGEELDITQAIEAIRLALRDLEGNVSPGAICGALTVKLR